MNPTLNMPIGGHVIVSISTDLNLGDKVYFFDAVPFCDTPVLRAGTLRSIDIDMSYTKKEEIPLGDAFVSKAACKISISDSEWISKDISNVFTDKESALASIEVIE